MFMLKIKLQAFYLTKAYAFRHWLFAWNVDTEGDIIFSVAGMLHFTKYKEHTIVKFGRGNFVRAAKYVRAVE